MIETLDGQIARLEAERERIETDLARVKRQLKAAKHARMSVHRARDHNRLWSNRVHERFGARKQGAAA